MGYSLSNVNGYVLTNHSNYDTPAHSIRKRVINIRIGTTFPILINNEIGYQQLRPISTKEEGSVIIHSRYLDDIVVSKNTPLMTADGSFRTASDIIDSGDGASINLRLFKNEEDFSLVNASVIPHYASIDKFMDFVVPGFHYMSINGYLLGDMYLENKLIGSQPIEKPAETVDPANSSTSSMPDDFDALYNMVSRGWMYSSYPGTFTVPRIIREE